LRNRLIRIYHRRGAGRPIRVVWTLEELGAPYELVIMTPEEAASEEHRSRHPLSRVPVLEDSAGTAFESTGLCLHLADLHPGAGLIPDAGTHGRALVYQWALFAMTEIEPPAIESYRRREDHPELSGAAAQRARGGIDAIDDALQGKGYLVGDRFTVADVVVSEVVRIAGRIGVFESQGRMAEYLAAMKARPARERATARLA
jgi:glutathione S-transferase